MIPSAHEVREALDGMTSEEVYAYIEQHPGCGAIRTVLPEAIIMEHQACRTRFPVTFDRNFADRRMLDHITRCRSLSWWRRRRQRRSWARRIN